MRIYQLLLRLLPRERRLEYGDEMARAFSSILLQARREAGSRGVMVAWWRELLGLLRFAVRGRFGRFASPSPMALRSAWKGVRARGGAAIFSVTLLAIAIAANGVVFSIVDALTFLRYPYPDAERLVVFENATRTTGPALLKSEFASLRVAAQGVASDIAAFNRSRLFVTGVGAAEEVAVLNITPNFFDVIGVRPEWGRTIVPTDLLVTDSDAVVISEALATSHFGSPSAAVGEALETTEFPLRVLGVMPATFRFPDGQTRIWRGYDLAGPIAENIFATTALARVGDGRDAEVAAAGLRARGAEGEALFRSQPYISGAVDSTESWALLGAALCLLLTACANVCSVELAGALSRTRTSAIQRALGASSGQLARIALIEGGLIVGAATALSAALASVALAGLTSVLPARYTQLPNSIDIDGRVVAFMALMAVSAWLITTLPVIALASKTDIIAALTPSGRTQTGARGTTRGRQVLTVAQIALSVLLLVSGLLYVRTYLARIALDKGFDSTNLAEVSLTIPPQLNNELLPIAERLADRLRALPGVIAVTEGGPPPNGDSPMIEDYLDVNGLRVEAPSLRVGRARVLTNYLETVGIPLVDGRRFNQGEPPQNVIVARPFADRFWPDGAVGGSFRLDRSPIYTIVGVVGQVRTRWDSRVGLSRPDEYVFYTPTPALSVRAASAPVRPLESRRSTSTRFYSLSVRLESRAALSEVLAATRSDAPQFAVSATMVDDVYADWENDSLVLTQVVGSFGILAFLTALAGVYGVMAFLVVSRTRELGVRMALGASQRDVVALVVGSAGRLTVIGTVAGAVAAFAVSRSIEAQLFGVAATDPATYIAVAASVALGTLLATWQPTRRAARVDPAITLRAE